MHVIYRFSCLILNEHHIRIFSHFILRFEIHLLIEYLKRNSEYVNGKINGFATRNPARNIENPYCLIWFNKYIYLKAL